MALAQPWHHVCRVVPGPSYEQGNFIAQMDDPSTIYCYAAVPDSEDVQCWATSCLQLKQFRGSGPFSGWSPGRSLAVVVVKRRDPWTIFEERLYYRAGDFGFYDVALQHHSGSDYECLVTSWYSTYDKFVRLATYLALHAELPQLAVPRMIMSEVKVWMPEVVTKLARRLGSANEVDARRALVCRGMDKHQRTISIMAQLCIPEVFLMYPEFVLFLVQTYMAGTQQARPAKRTASTTITAIAAASVSYN